MVNEEREISASVDAGWQGRRSGKAYNTCCLSGHATMIGAKTGKVLDWSCRIKSCHVCIHAVKENQSARPHICQKNWEGSSKAMEQDMVVEMVKKVNQSGVRVSTIIGDDDAATISQL